MPLEELPGLLRAARLRRLDRLRERLWLLRLMRADPSELDAAFRRLSREEAALGRRPLSALHAASDPAVRARILELRRRKVGTQYFPRESFVSPFFCLDASTILRYHYVHMTTV